MKYVVQNGVHIVEIPTTEFTIKLVDKKKKSCGLDTANAGFFATYSENGERFTLPVGHLICDFEADSPYTKKYCTERGHRQAVKFSFDCSEWAYDNPFHRKSLTTLIVRDGKAQINDLTVLPDGCSYAITGVPIMRHGEDVIFATYVKGQGWSGSELYATWHTFIGLKGDPSKIYLMAMRTTTSNMIRSMEAYQKFKNLGFRDVIKLDGGGSFYFNVGGKITQTSENRQINTIIKFDTMGDINPYTEPTKALRLWNTNREGNRWLQWELNHHGYNCEIDGSFGLDTRKQLRAFQKDHGLEVDGCCGPATRAELKG